MTVPDGANVVLAGATVGLALIALGAAVVAWVQLETAKRFEFLKVVEEPEIRKARRILYKRLRNPKRPPPSAWWESEDPDNVELEAAASDVCASFDIVGLMAKRQNRKFFVEEWRHPICWTYAVLEDYIKYRNPGGYRGYRSLYEEAQGRARPRVLSTRVLTIIAILIAVALLIVAIVALLIRH
jgi:hypothetical protein